MENEGKIEKKRERGRSTARVGVSLCSSMVSVKRKREKLRIHEATAAVFLG